MNIRLILILLLSPFLFTSCGDSNEKLIKDQIEYIDDMTEILNKVSDGSLSSSEAAEKIKAHGKKGDEIMKRKEKLLKEMTPELEAELKKKYEEKTKQSVEKFMEAVIKLGQSGRATKELSDAIENMKEY